MRPEDVQWHTIDVRGGSLHYPLTGEWHAVGDREVPSPIILRLRDEDSPVVDVTIAVVDHVPRIVDLHFTRQDNGREIRQKDLDISLADLVEQAAALASARVMSTDSGGSPEVSWSPRAFAAEQRTAEIRRAMRTIQTSRRRSQRQMTPARLQHVADVYQAQESGGIEAVADAYNVHRATAARWIAQARAAGILPARGGAAAE